MCILGSQITSLVHSIITIGVSFFLPHLRRNWSTITFFSLVVEALCLERLLEALHALRLANCVSFDASHEISCCDYFVREFPAVLSFCPDEPKTFLGVARMLRLMTRSINVLVGRGQISELLDQLPHRVAGEMLANFCERLSIGIRQTDVQSPDTLTFKFCLDDCEVLNEVQRKSLVTLVRTSRAPVSWVIASVGRRWESGETFHSVPTVNRCGSQRTFY